MASAWTALGYEADWRRFAALVEARAPGLDPTGVSGKSVAQFVQYLAGQRYAYSTCRRAAFGVLARLRQVHPERFPAGVVPPELKTALRDVREAERARRQAG